MTLPASVRLEAAPAGASLSGMLAAGEIDAIISPRAPSCHARGDGNVGWLFDDPTAAAIDYYRRTRVFPIMHMVGVRRSLADRNPWLPAAVLKAFTQAKAVALARLADTAAAKVMLPFVEEQLRGAHELLGEDYWSYGLAANQGALENFLRHHHAQGCPSGCWRRASCFTSRRTRRSGCERQRPEAGAGKLLNARAAGSPCPTAATRV